MKIKFLRYKQYYNPLQITYATQKCKDKFGLYFLNSNILRIHFLDNNILSPCFDNLEKY